MTAEPWALSEVGNALDRARDDGEPATTGALREQVGIGHEDLQDVLSALRERGEAVEAAPGEWRRPFEDEQATQRAAATEAADGEEDGGVDEPSTAAPARGARRGAVMVATEDGQVVLTAKVLAALDAETIGKIVQAGVEDAGEDVFTLTVRP